MAIDFPDSPTTGDAFTVGDRTWIYDGVKWELQGGVIGPQGPEGPQGPAGPTDLGLIIALGGD